MKHIFTRLLSILFLCAISISAMAQEAYAVMSKDSTTLTFYYDNKKASREGTAYELNPGENRPELEKTKDHIILYTTDNDVDFTTVVFDGSFKDARPISCAHWFSGFKNLKKIEGIENLNTSNVTDMYRMFDNCANLKTIYAGAGWIIGKDTDSEGMFWNSTKLVGGKGTIFSPDATDASRAKIDGGKANPGYFTAKK